MKILKAAIPRILFFFLFIMESLIVSGQTAIKVSGKIMNGDTEPSSYASVGLFKSTDSTLIKGTLTTVDGNFIIQNIPAGSYYLSASTMGYKKYKSQTFSVNDNEDKKIDFIYLIKDNYQLNEVKIVSQKPLIENRIDKMVLNVENSVLAAGNTALELLQKAPGVVFDGKQVSLRGKSNVLIMVDGKQTYLSQSQLNNLLNSTQASMIQSIEIMTNPSSKYDAAGNAGIINIRMKKNQDYGTNLTLNLSAGYGVYRKTSGGFDLNHKTRLYNFFSNFTYTNNVEFSHVEENRSATNADKSTLFNTYFFSKYPLKVYNFKVGTDFNIDKESTIGFIVSGRLFRGATLQSATNMISSPSGKADSTIISSNEGAYPINYLTYNLNYKTVLDSSGTELSLSTDYSSSRDNEKQNYNNRYLDQNLVSYKPDYIYRSFMPAKVDVYVGKADFSHPFNKLTKLEAGLKYSKVKTDNNLSFDNLQSDGNYLNDPKRSNQFLYTEDITAAYLNLNTEFGDYSLQAGLRAERTTSVANSVTNASLVKRSYTNLFPTLFLRKKLDENQTLGVSFGRRIDRPDYSSLNPFVLYIDDYNYMYGNPYLKPQYTNSYEINYVLKGQYSASLGYKRTSDVIVWVLLTDPVTSAIAQTNLNLSENNYYNLNLNAPVTILKWWKTYNNLSLFYNQYKSAAVEGAPLQLNKLVYQVNTNHIFTVDDRSSIEMSGNYTSSNVYGLFFIKPNYGFDLGISRSFFDKKMDIKVALNDVFNTRGKRTNYNSFPNSAYTIKSNYDSRVFRLTASYRFGNSKLKTSNKNGSANDEERRIKKG